MATERQVQETISKCVSTIVYYHNEERSTAADEWVVADVRAITRLVRDLGFSDLGVARRILQPVEGELIDRYGHEVGARLFAKFADAFEDSFEDADRIA